MVVAVNTNGHAAADPLVKLEQALIATPMPAQDEPSPPQTPHKRQGRCRHSRKHHLQCRCHHKRRTRQGRCRRSRKHHRRCRCHHKRRTRQGRCRRSRWHHLQCRCHRKRRHSSRNVAVAVASTICNAVATTNATFIGMLPSQSQAPSAMPLPPNTTFVQCQARAIVIGRSFIVVACRCVSATTNNV